MRVAIFAVHWEIDHSRSDFKCTLGNGLQPTSDCTNGIVTCSDVDGFLELSGLASCRDVSITDQSTGAVAGQARKGPPERVVVNRRP